MSVRAALAKLAACACGCAVIGGGAVHVAEAQRPGILKTVKPVKTAKHTPSRTVRRHRTVVTYRPSRTEPVQSAQVTQVINVMPQALPEQQMVNAGGGATATVVSGSSGSSGFSGSFGGFGGGFFGGSSGGSVIISSTSSGSTSTSTSSSSSSSSSTSTSSSTSGGISTSGGFGSSSSSSSSTSGGWSTSTSGGSTGNPPVDVPEPSSVILFGLGVLGLIVGRKLSTPKRDTIS